jgi:hypothetical protein
MTENHPLSWSIVLRIYWLIFWRTAAIWLALQFTFNSLLTWLVATKRLAIEDLLLWSKISTALILAVIGLVTVRMALRKRYRGFKIQIVSDQPVP